MVRGLPSRKNLLLLHHKKNLSLIYNMDDYHAENMNFVG